MLMHVPIVYGFLPEINVFVFVIFFIITSPDNVINLLPENVIIFA